MVMSKTWSSPTLRSIKASMRLLAVLLLLGVTQRPLTAQPNGNPGAPQPSAGGSAAPSGLESDVLALARELFIEMHCFWSNFGPDNRYGGFYATLGRQGNPIQPTAKGVVQQARHLYFFSAHHMALNDPWVGPLVLSDRGGASPGSTACGAPLTDSAQGPNSSGASMSDQQALAKKLADQAHGFLTLHMRNPATGLFYTTVTPNGSDVIDAGPLLNGNLMAVYALAVYARAFNYTAARDEALETFLALDALLYDKQYGGYNELLSVPPWGPNPKTLNGLLALTQATMELARVVPENPTVMDRLRECLRLFPERVVVMPEGYARQEFSANWSTAVGDASGGGGRNEVSYGMQLAASWVLLEAIPVAYGNSGGGGGSGGDDAAGSVRAAALKLGNTAVMEGYHYGHGGFFLSGSWNRTSDKTWDKLWWVQAEALPALWQLYISAASSAGPYDTSSGSGAATYLHYLKETLQWIRNCQSDSKYGEWYWLTYGDCSVAQSYNSGGYEYAGSVKGNIWKASYHNGRALLTLIRYLLGGAPGVPAASQQAGCTNVVGTVDLGSSSCKAVALTGLAYERVPERWVCVARGLSNVGH
ncbi:hypothetical protein VOLCADRAFT_86621 [Volvox carteri f. nagariensis]|uniref:N-acylglucosamine 2-epimerase n=1 Tax=Volvox carteri f. nagariensis TaxID=3068 RepID=D8TJ58_VOLCA|nr:uncharacterized protein VOLCADRAFT_86621 [Volvox carteri f. nagariensis]EFJ52481.1 hypothetical protein VOLCADRAFT_86621 [Volvox carteri f. nagariensis]|eukprot:XP_002946554.1 hypothetical protein VOLCADRAFT_86621 [Volvox carteri f. nagariensis]